MRYTLTLLLALLASASTLQSQVISGTLLEAGTRSPLADGVVSVLDQTSAVVARLRTDSAGAFAVELPRAGTFRLRAEQPGFGAAVTSELSVGSMETLNVEFVVSRDLVVLEPVVVTAQTHRLTVGARRFYERVGSTGFATYITRRDIEKRRPLRTTELFTRIPGVWITPAAGENQVSIRGRCRPSVYVDGVRVNEYRSIDELARPVELEGVEVYRSPQHAPPEFTGVQAGCAVILMWTRIT